MKRKNIQPSTWQLVGAIVSSVCFAILWRLGAENLVIGLIVLALLVINIKLNSL